HAEIQRGPPTPAANPRRARPKLIATLLICWTQSAAAAGAPMPTDSAVSDTKGSSAPNLTELSLDELTHVQFVTSVSKKREKLSDAAGAIDVVTGEDMENMGATSIPEA